VADQEEAGRAAVEEAGHPVEAAAVVAGHPVALEAVDGKSLEKCLYMLLKRYNTYLADNFIA